MSEGPFTTIPAEEYIRMQDAIKRGLERQTVFVLAFEYSDQSAFRICGVTDSRAEAQAWFWAGDDTNVYEANLTWAVRPWNEGIKGWREKQREGTLV